MPDAQPMLSPAAARARLNALADAEVQRDLTIAELEERTRLQAYLAQAAREADAELAEREAAAAELEGAELDSIRSGPAWTGPDAPTTGGQAEESLAAVARRRVRAIVQALDRPMEPADLRDAGIALAALSSSLEDLERADSRIWVHAQNLARWLRDLDRLLELIGEPADELRDQARTYWSVREGLRAELASLLEDADGGLTAPTFRPSSSPSIFDELARLQRDLQAPTPAGPSPAARELEEVRALVLERLWSRVQRRRQPDTVEELDLALAPVRGYVMDLETELETLVRRLAAGPPA